MAAVAVVVLTAGRCMLTAGTEDGFCAWWPRVDPGGMISSERRAFGGCLGTRRR
jgi:hypothetical protein